MKEGCKDGGPIASPAMNGIRTNLTYAFMKKRVLLLLSFMLWGVSTYAQTLGEFKPKDQSYGINKAKDATRVFIAGFNVNFQVYNETQDYKQGGAMLGGGQRGESLAEVSVGLDGIEEKTVQEITDQLYNDFVEKIKANGLTVVSPDEASKIESYEDFMRIDGGKITMAEIPGVMTCIPNGYSYFVKKLDKDGKAKKGGFLGNPAMMYPKISKDLNDAIVAYVDLTVLFVSEQETFKGNGAKVKVKTFLRLIGTEAVTMTSDAKIKMKGQNTITSVVSTVAFYHGKVGAGATTSYSGTLAKPLAINGVLEDEKITAFARGGVDAGTATIYGTYYSARNAKNSNAKIISVDPVKYKEGVYTAANKFLTFHADEFLSKLKK